MSNIVKKKKTNQTDGYHLDSLTEVKPRKYNIWIHERKECTLKNIKKVEPNTFQNILFCVFLELDVSHWWGLN